MTTKLVSILFNFFDDLDLEHETFNDGLEYIHVKFLVDSSNVETNDEGELIFTSRYRKLLTKILSSFIKRHIGYFDKGFYNDEAFDALHYATKLNQDLQESLTNHFVIPGKIELFQIQFYGNWEAYIGDKKSVLRQQRLK